MFHTKLTQVHSRAFRFFGGYVAVLTLVFLSFIYVGIKSDLMYAQIILPFASVFESFVDALDEPEYETKPAYDSTVRYNYSNDTKVYYNGEEVPLNSNEGTNQNEDQGGTYHIVYPTSKPLPTFEPFPTFKPYEFPTRTPEQEAFNEEFERESTRMKEEFDKMKEEICTNNPSMCQ